MELSTAKRLLNTAVREELRDHAFGDAEVYWSRAGATMAVGYFGGGHAGVSIMFPDGKHAASFDGFEARELRTCGELKRVDRNDETGPDEFVEGKVMPGLTKAGVLQELTGSNN